MPWMYLLEVKYGSPSAADSSSSSSSSSGTTTALFRNASQGGSIAVRAAYLGLCAQAVGEGDYWVCAPGARSLKSVLVKSDNIDPLDAVDVAARFKGDVVFPGLVFGAMALSLLAFLGLATFPGWHQEQDAATGSDVEVRPFPSRTVSQVCLFLLFVASMFLLSSALWQHVAAATAASTIASTTQYFLECSVGATAMAFIWMAFVLTVLVFVMIAILLMSIHLLDRLINE